MFAGWQWSRIFEDSDQLLSVILGEAEPPACPADASAFALSLDRSMRAAASLYLGYYEEAEDSLAEKEKDRLSLCEQLVHFWLLTELEEPETVYLKLERWQARLSQERKGWSCILPKGMLEGRDFRLYQRCLPVLRYYLASQLEQWSEVVKLQAQADFDQARGLGINQYILAQLRFSWRFAEARQAGSLSRLLAVAENWYELSQKKPRMKMSQTHILETALALEQADRAREAMLWIQRGLRENPLQYEFMLCNARISKRLGQVEASLNACDELISNFQDDYAGYCLRSNMYFLIGFYDQARNDADRAIQLAPDNPNSYMARAFVNLQLGHYQLALDDFGQVLQRDPQRYDALRGQGKCLSMLGRDHDALVCFQSLRRKYPEDTDLYYEMADVLFAAGYLEDCEKVCLSCLEIDDTYVSAYVILGMIAVRYNDEEKATRLLRKAVSLEPDNPFALNELSYLLHLQGEDEQAIELVDRAIEESPEYADALCNKGIMLYYRSEFDQAAETFERAVRLLPEHVPAWVGKGNSLTQLCDFDEALLCYDQALRIDPRNAEACHGKAILYRMLGLEEEVRKWQERAHRLDPSFDED